MLRKRSDTVFIHRREFNPLLFEPNHEMCDRMHLEPDNMRVIAAFNERLFILVQEFHKLR
jgi:hypothetical protein